MKQLIASKLLQKNMGRSKIENRNIRKLRKTGAGRSLEISLPMEEIKELGWRVKQKVTVKRVGKKLIIEDWK